MMGKREGAREPNRTLAGVAVPGVKAAGCIKALSAPRRRCILRALHEAGEAQSSAELAKAFGVPVGNISYHVDVLKEYGAVALTDTQQKRGSTEHFHASTVMSNELVVKLLEATRAEDE
jgi:DNA-binding transcriptional ArsR family regulator